MIHQHATLEETVYFSFASNNKTGSGDDGATPAAHVRESGAAAGDAPISSPTPILLSHADYPAGAYEVAVEATADNGFASGGTYSVYCTLAVDGENPTGFIGSVTLGGIVADPLDAIIEGTLTLKQAIQEIRAFAVGECSGGNTDQLTYQKADGSGPRVIKRVDQYGNRSNVTSYYD
jgi:hypothetical protein